MAITKELIREKWGKEFKPVEEVKPLLPPGEFIPSVNKEEAAMMCEEARKAVEEGMARGKKLMDDLFYKMSMSHKNPYVGVKPLPKKIETAHQKANYLKNMVGIQWN